MVTDDGYVHGDGYRMAGELDDGFDDHGSELEHARRRQRGRASRHLGGGTRFLERLERERLVDRSLPFVDKSERRRMSMAGGNSLTRRTLCIGVGATVAMAGAGRAALCGQ